MKLLAFLLLGLFCIATGEKKRFDGYKVYRMHPTTHDQLEILQKFENSLELDFWSEAGHLGSPVDIMVAPHDQKGFVEIINSYGMGAVVYVEDVQHLIDQETVADFSARANMTWTQYYTIEGIHAWLDTLPGLYPGKVEVISAGRSYEGRDIKGVKLTFGPGRKVVMIEAGIHAREWISPATATYLINRFLTTTSPAVKRIAESFEWHIFPSTNPDGYVFSHTSNRLWRKTRTPYGTCFGADPNRNWDFTWGVHGSSTSACSDTYRGPTPFSEVEVRGVRDVASSLAPRMDAYISMHSYGQYFLIPFGNTTDHLANYDDMRAMGGKAITALAGKYGTRYRIGNTAEILYKASGTSTDWVKNTYKNVGIAFTYEFRDTGVNGFVLPPGQIIPNCEEVLDSFVALFEEAENLGYVTLVRNK